MYIEGGGGGGVLREKWCKEMADTSSDYCYCTYDIQNWRKRKTKERRKANYGQAEEGQSNIIISNSLSNLTKFILYSICPFSAPSPG